MKRILLITAVVALIGATSAQAHYGNRWFDSKAHVQSNVRDIYWAKNVNCFRLATAHSIAGANAFAPRLYDHFGCALYSTWSGRVCIATVHIVGEQWYSIVLTSFPRGSDYSTCGPQDIRRRAAG